MPATTGPWVVHRSPRADRTGFLRGRRLPERLTGMASPFLVQFFQKLPKQTRAVVQTSLYGLVAGAGAVLFQSSMTWLYNLGLVRLSRASATTFLVGSFAVIMAASLLVGWLLSAFCRDAAGSGIPQLKLAFWKEFGLVPWRVAWVKFVAGVASIGGGFSLGREGPSVQLAGAVASNLAAAVGEPKQARRAAAAAGAAAGLAAAFNTPLAAATFVLEEIIGDLNSRLLGSVLLASVLGALVVQALVGKQPAFTLTNVTAPSWVAYALTPVVATLASGVGIYFQRGSLALRSRMKTVQRVPPWLHPALGGLITWGLGAGLFLATGHLGVFSLGYDDLSSALGGGLGWKIAAALLAAKFIATVTGYGFGGCGGIFSPTLFFGGMTGLVVTGLIGLGWPVAWPDVLALMVVGMSACLGAVVWAPVTGILIVFEMTHEFALVPALMLGALVSQAITRRLSRANFYDALLEQDGHFIEHVRPPRDLQSWQQLPVSAIVNFRPVVVRDLAPAEVRKVLQSHPYQRFPVVQAGQLTGLLIRREAEAALAEKRPPRLEAATTCVPAQTIRDVQSLLIESANQAVVVLDRPGGNVLGLFTLHDLLRVEVAMANSSGE